MMLLTNGDCHGASYSNPNGDQVSKIWYLLTPNSTGSYVNGTWSTIATMSTQRLYYGSNVMQNGNVFVVGGEYSGPNGEPERYQYRRDLQLDHQLLVADHELPSTVLRRRSHDALAERQHPRRLPGRTADLHLQHHDEYLDADGDQEQ